MNYSVGLHVLIPDRRYPGAPSGPAARATLTADQLTFQPAFRRVRVARWRCRRRPPGNRPPRSMADATRESLANPWSARRADSAICMNGGRIFACRRLRPGTGPWRWRGGGWSSRFRPWILRCPSRPSGCRNA